MKRDIFIKQRFYRESILLLVFLSQRGMMGERHTDLLLEWTQTELLLLNWAMQGEGCLIFKEAIFFVPTLQPASLRPFGHIQVPRRVIPGMVTLLIQDPIRALLYRHVTIMIRGDRITTEIALHNTTQAVTKETDLNTIQEVTKATVQLPGRRRRPPLGDLGQVNPSTLAVTINTRHVINGINSPIDSKDHPLGMIVAIRTRFPTTATDLTKMSQPPSLLTDPFMYRNRRNITIFQHRGHITMQGIKPMRMSRVLAKLSLWFKTVKWIPWSWQYGLCTYQLVSWYRVIFDLESNVCPFRGRLIYLRGPRFKNCLTICFGTEKYIFSPEHLFSTTSWSANWQLKCSKTF